MKEFHPIVAKWFSNTLGQPTDIQEQAWPEIKKRKHTLIAAPTGSGKTLAAFFAIIDDLVKQGLEGKLMDKTQVVYVSPLKALSNDIERNLQFPLKGIKQGLEDAGLEDLQIKVGLRTGDTTPSQRAAMIKNPPHILVSTPESLYLLLTSESGRKMLSDVKTIIVDEIHALVGDKRGSHLALSMERLNRLTSYNLARIGLSATQKPIARVANYLVGAGGMKEGVANCEIVDTGHKRELVLDIEVPRSPLNPVMANEVWEEVYDRLEQLIGQHKTTLIFVNTRRLAERMAHNLSNRIGAEHATAHHGSMSKEHRYDAEQRLKSGQLKVLVATASLELGIDVGSIDLVCQIGSPGSIAAFLQRVGRSGHSIYGTPKGIIFPLSRDELVECVAIVDAIKRGELDEIIMPEKPLDILAQQVVAELAGEDYQEEELYELFKSAYPYRDLKRKEFDGVITMLADGFTTRRGRKGAYIHHDVVNARVRARKNARITALISGGAIPDNFDYDVTLEPTSTFIGSLNEDFAIESLPGDVFQLGNNSYRILKVETGKVRVEDAGGAPPSIPFWLGEAPGRTKELSEAVSRLRSEISSRLGDLEEIKKLEELEEDEIPDNSWKEDAIKWLQDGLGLNLAVCDQLVTYLATAKAALGEMPTRDTLVMERFFDEAGDMHLVIHSPFGSRMNRAWGLSLRKRFCRKFNFELQAAATEDNIILSLGATHSFPIDEVYNYLNPKTVRDVLIQALLDAPMFEIRWRWNASRALAILRRQGSKKVPPQIQRSQSEDLIALVFPDQLACLENIVGEREVPDHPLVHQTIDDCLYEAMDIDELEGMLKEIKAGNKTLLGRDLREPSPMAQEILNAKPYAFLDPAPLEERRTNAVRSRGWMDPATAREIGSLDAAALETVKAEAWPMVRSEDELHDALVLLGYMTEEEGRYGDGLDSWEGLLDSLIAQNRATRLITANGAVLWVAAERVPLLEAIYSNHKYEPSLSLPAKIKNQEWEETDAIRETIRGRLESVGPILSNKLATSADIKITKIEQALMALENDGFVIRGQFSPGIEETEWCERRLLARIHRYTLQKLRKEIEPVSAADFMRFLFAWHGLDTEHRPEGPEALSKVLELLDGYEAPAAAWESDILPARVNDYDFFWLDVLCLSGKLVWGRFRNEENGNGGKSSNPIKTSPVSITAREHISLWRCFLKEGSDNLSNNAQTIFDLLTKEGASFYDDILKKSELMPGQLDEAMAELVSNGRLTSDSYTGLRALLVPLKYKSETSRRRKKVVFTMDQAGRWSLIDSYLEDLPKDDDRIAKQKDLEKVARIFLRRYGVVCRKLIDKEAFAPPWRDLVRVYRTLEARGEIRGGRFIDGLWGEQFALPEAITLLRKIRKESKTNKLVAISATDPLNLTGYITPGGRVPAHLNNRILYRDGIPVAFREGKEVKYAESFDPKEKWKLHTELIQRKIPPKVKAYLGRGIY